MSENERLNPDAYEELYILNIESQNKILISDIENFCSRMKENVVTPEDLSAIIRYLKMYEGYFLSYISIVDRLDKIGKPQLSKRMNEILYDIRETITIFQGLQKNNGKKEVNEL